MLKIENLQARVHETAILKGIDLVVKPGEVHAIMGPNGSGKSTLASVLAGRPGYEVTDGQVEFNGDDLLALAPELRAAKGLFLSFQYPVEIPGVNNLYFLKAAVNSVRQQNGLPPYDAVDFIELVNSKIKAVAMPEHFLKRPVNAGFSGGEKSAMKYCRCYCWSPSWLF